MIPYENFPAHYRLPLQRYLEHHIETGSGLRAVLENNLIESFAKLDVDGIANLKEIIFTIYNYFPLESWGSRELVDSWLSYANYKIKRTQDA